MALQAVDLAVVGEAEVEDTDCLVLAAGGEELVEGRVEGESVDGVHVGILKDDGGAGVGFRAQVHQLHGEIVRD